MQYRRFGKTDLDLSVFSLGTMRSLIAADTFEKTVYAAIQNGINHLETARGYGQSEVLLGQVLKQLNETERSRLVVTTKIPPTPDSATMAAHIEESLKRLHVDTIDCLAVHGINTPQHLAWIRDPEGCMVALQTAQAAGKIRHLGFSTHGPQEVIVAAIKTRLFSFINLHYYFFFPHHAPVIALAQQADMGIFIISPADKGGQLYTPPDTLRQLCNPFEPLHLTYRWLLSDPRVTTLSIGPANSEELASPLAICDRTDPLTDREETTLQRLQTAAQEALGADYCHQCYNCLPCPEAINIPEVLRLRNLAIAYEMTSFGQYRYRMFENAGHWFPGSKANRCTDCGDCLPRCPTHLPIPTLLRDTHQRLSGPERRRLWG